jgi:uncharacterized HAD superfamily protein
MTKQTIAVHIDEVLADSAADFIAYSNKKWGTNLSIDDFSEHWAQMWQLDHEKVKAREQAIFNSGIHIKYKTIDQSLEVLSKLAGDYKLVTITSRSSVLEPTTQEWLDKHYRGIFKEAYFSGIYDKPHPNRHRFTKANLLKSISADYLIDDQPKHCFAAAELGIKSILFGDYKWNRDIKLPKGVVRVKTWPEVAEYFNV